MEKAMSDDLKALAFVDAKNFLHRVNLTQGVNSLNPAFNRPRLHLNTLIMTPAKITAHPLNKVQTDNGDNILDANDAVQLCLSLDTLNPNPAALANNASAVSIEVFKTSRQYHQNFLALKDQLMNHLETIAGEKIIQDFKETLDVDEIPTSLQLVTYLDKTWGPHNLRMLSLIFDKINSIRLPAYASLQDFNTEKSKLTKLFNFYSASGHLINALQRLTIAETFLSMNHVAMEAVNDFYKARTVLEEQTMDNLFLLVADRLGSMRLNPAIIPTTTPASAFGFAQATSGPTPRELQLAAENASLKRSLSNRPTVGATAPPVVQPIKTTSVVIPGVNYCFKHGYNGHRGLGCRFMTSRPTEYNEAQLKCRNHLALPGACNHC